MIAASSTLFRYISRSFILHFAVLMLILLGIVYVFDLIELMRRTAKLDYVSFGLVMRMTALKAPEVGQAMLPFAVLFAAIYTCWKLNRTHELVVIRAAGLSVWQFLSPMFVSALFLGLFATTVINPVSSLFLAKYEQMEITDLQKDSNLVNVSRTGIWLRQPTPQGYALIHSSGFDQQEWRLSKVIIFFFDEADQFLYRIDSPLAYLKDGHWEIRDAVINDRDGAARNRVRRLPTELTIRKIEESFAAPETISFWKIPEYVHIMEETGFPTARLRLHFQSLLAQPFLFAAMILLAATFSLRPPRIGGAGVMIVLGVLTGFSVFFIESMLHAFGISQKIPVYLAAWTPAAVSLLLGTTALLHLEDG
jgi:lipopolysaccharide export system permease protein